MQSKSESKRGFVKKPRAAKRVRNLVMYNAGAITPAQLERALGLHLSDMQENDQSTLNILSIHSDESYCFTQFNDIVEQIRSRVGLNVNSVSQLPEALFRYILRKKNIFFIGEGQGSAVLARQLIGSRALHLPKNGDSIFPEFVDDVNIGDEAFGQAPDQNAKLMRYIESGSGEHADATGIMFSDTDRSQVLDSYALGPNQRVAKSKLECICALSGVAEHLHKDFFTKLPKLRVMVDMRAYGTGHVHYVLNMLSSLICMGLDLQKTARVTFVLWSDTCLRTSTGVEVLHDARSDKLHDFIKILMGHPIRQYFSIERADRYDIEHFDKGMYDDDDDVPFAIATCDGVLARDIATQLQADKCLLAFPPGFTKHREGLVLSGKEVSIDDYQLLPLHTPEMSFKEKSDFVQFVKKNVPKKDRLAIGNFLKIRRMGWQSRPGSMFFNSTHPLSHNRQSHIEEPAKAGAHKHSCL